MRVAMCQMEVTFENKEANYIRAGKMIESSAEQGARMVFFPEMTFTGFSMNTAITKEHRDNSPSIHLMSGYAKQFGIAIGFGITLAVEDSEMCENHYMVIGPDGELLADYVKIHPFSVNSEDTFFVGGEEPVIFEYEGRSFGLAICYDLRFPELFSKLSKKAEVLLVAANWPDSRAEHWKCLLRARAVENQSYVLGVNCVGSFLGNCYSGHSMVVDPKGGILACRSGEEMILLVEIEDVVLGERLAFPVKRDRRESLYRDWYVDEQ